MNIEPFLHPTTQRWTLNVSTGAECSVQVGFVSEVRARIFRLLDVLIHRGWSDGRLLRAVANWAAKGATFHIISFSEGQVNHGK